MLRRWWRNLAAVFAMSFVLVGPQAIAHDFPLHTVMNSFVKIEPNQANLIIRVPLDMVHSVSFPLDGRVQSGILRSSNPAGFERGCQRHPDLGERGAAGSHQLVRAFDVARGSII